ncbi:hypothetical protein CEV32_4182 [Brucella rhizosphaerae]|uniref:Uncharacterized protein n=1 Tax=Brucella rhizosphaerae TaxID=571254 RepID=A0A256FNY4_9HYPH|nr:hypothetical protein CEV32_4182 [Brucella rhizosphaerae]
MFVLSHCPMQNRFALLLEMLTILKCPPETADDLLRWNEN